MIQETDDNIIKAHPNTMAVLQTKERS